MVNFKVRVLDSGVSYHLNDSMEVYYCLYCLTHDHELSAEISSWAELAPFGDNWTCEEAGVDVSIIDGEYE